MTPLTKPVRRVTQTTLDGSFGCDRDRRIIVTLVPGNGRDISDMLELRPERTRRTERIAVSDVLRFAIRARVNSQVLEKAREKKAKRQERLARRRQDAYERRFLEKCRKEAQV